MIRMTSACAIWCTER